MIGFSQNIVNSASPPGQPSLADANFLGNFTAPEDLQKEGMNAEVVRLQRHWHVIVLPVSIVVEFPHSGNGLFKRIIHV